MRLVVLGTGPFAVPMFGALLDSPHEVAGLVTRPTPPAKGREKSPVNPMRDLAESRGVAVDAPESINSDEGLGLLRSLAPDLLVVCDYGQILSPAALAVAPLGGINLHASLLPKYRGAAPIHWAILRGETETGVSVIHMTPRLDGGPILSVRRAAIGPEETQPELEQRLAQLGTEAVHEALDTLLAWDRASPIGQSQDATLATKAPRLKKEQGAVDWSRSAAQICNQVRALKPWPGTFSFWHRAGQEPVRLVLDQVRLVDAASNAPGEVVEVARDRLVVGAGEGAVAILALQPAGKRVLGIEEFLRGYHVRLGDRFGPAS
ncbi:MAG: methionyl-tRNA formyltransferase [Pirellulaceae bacterium]|nr:methionyl-tRNA formyltransferase [Pirellulaceae bacterium]